MLFCAAIARPSPSFVRAETSNTSGHEPPEVGRFFFFVPRFDESPKESSTMHEAHGRAPATTHGAASGPAQLTFSRRCSTAGRCPYHEVQWEKRTASITDSK